MSGIGPVERELTPDEEIFRRAASISIGATSTIHLCLFLKKLGMPPFRGSFASYGFIDYADRHLGGKGSIYEGSN